MSCWYECRVEVERDKRSGYTDTLMLGHAPVAGVVVDGRLLARVPAQEQERERLCMVLGCVVSKSSQGGPQTPATYPGTNTRVGEHKPTLLSVATRLRV